MMPITVQEIETGNLWDARGFDEYYEDEKRVRKAKCIRCGSPKEVENMKVLRRHNFTDKARPKWVVRVKKIYICYGCAVTEKP